MGCFKWIVREQNFILSNMYCLLSYSGRSDLPRIGFASGHLYFSEVYGNAVYSCITKLCPAKWSEFDLNKHMFHTNIFLFTYLFFCFNF